jgi:hypothetical protein
VPVDPLSASIRALRDGAKLETPPVLTGHLKLKGAATSGSVLLMADPPDSTLASLSVGGTFNMVPIAKEVVGADGSFALRADPLVSVSAVESAVTGGKQVNFELLVTRDKKFTVYPFSRVHEASGAWVDPSVADGETAPAPTGNPDVTQVADANDSVDIALDHAAAEKPLVSTGVIDTSNQSDSPLSGGDGATTTGLQVHGNAVVTDGNAFLENMSGERVVIRSIKVVGAKHLKTTKVYFHTVHNNPPSTDLVGTADGFPASPLTTLKDPAGWSLNAHGDEGDHVEVVVGASLVGSATSGTFDGFEVRYAIGGTEFRIVTQSKLILHRTK